MGGFAIIPGVSGGTVALVLGIYERLITAVSRVDLTLLKMLVARRWKDAAERIDLRFLLALGTGIATGVIGLASTMSWLLARQPQLTSAAFFGLIIGSAWLVACSAVWIASQYSASSHSAACVSASARRVSSSAMSIACA